MHTSRLRAPGPQALFNSTGAPWQPDMVGPSGGQKDGFSVRGRSVSVSRCAVAYGASCCEI